MCQVIDFSARHVVRFAFAGLAAALLAGCADSSRFVGDPLGNPFKTASAVPSMPSSPSMSSVPSAGYGMSTPAPYSPMRSAVRTQSLMPSNSSVASYAAPSHASPRLASNYSAPRTERTASIAAPSGHGSWSAEGGMAVIAGNGDTASVLGARYNVPTDALLRANDFTSASAIQPGTRVVIPVYNANGAAPSRVAKVEKAEPVRHDHSSREKLLAKNEAPKHEAPKHEPAKPDMQARREAERDAKLAKYEKAEREAKEAKLAKYEKAEHEARMAHADDAKKLKWVKGAQPAKLADATKAHGREKAMAKLDRRKAEVQEAQETRKLAKADKPTRMAKADPAPVVEEAPRKAAPAPVDDTPTASLPPASAEKASTSGAPEFRWPAHGRIIQGFKSGGNDGINIAVPEGTAVKAAESGTVAYAGSEIKGFGNLVLIRHPNGYVTAYANNGDISVKRGEQVKRGQTIAKSGQSGNVASPQLHFELRKGSTPVDPTRYLAGL